MQVPDVAVFNNTLTYLSVESNGITSVDLDYFAQFPHLRSLHFSRNPLVNISLTKSLSVIYLVFLDTELAVLDMNIFTLTGNLKYLDVRKNPVQTYIAPTQSHMITIETLIMYQLTVVAQEEKLENLSSLKQLTFSNTGMKDIDFQFFSELINPRELDLGYNYFNSISFF